MTSRTMIFVGSYCEALYRNYRYSTKVMVLVVEGRVWVRGIEKRAESGRHREEAARVEAMFHLAAILLALGDLPPCALGPKYGPR